MERQYRTSPGGSPSKTDVRVTATETESTISGCQTPSPTSSSSDTPKTPSAAHVAVWGKSGSFYDLSDSTACTTPDVGLVRRESLGHFLSNLDRVPASKAIVPAADGTTFAYRYPSSMYEVDELSPRDDSNQLPPWKRRLNRLTPVTTALSMMSYIAYLVTRFYYTIKASRLNGSAKFAMAWLFMATELIIMGPIIIHQFFQVLAWRGRKRPMRRLKGDTYAPTIDVIITCCREDLDVVRDTALSCCDLDYPADRYRIIVADDGADNDVMTAVEDLKNRYPNIYYHARVKQKGVPHHAKAGNLVGATEFADNLEGGSAEFLACLDADMLPVKGWLRAIIAGHVKDPQLGLVCPPQLFYNVPDNDPLTQRLDGFAHVMEPVKDSVGVAWCTGSGYAIRRTALDSIGGWPVGTLAEDTLTSSLLLGKGWKTAYIHEALQWGTVPEDYASHLKQRTRWTLGTLQMSKTLNFFTYGSIVQHMTIYQRLSGLVIAFDALWKPFIFIALLIVPIALISGRALVAFSDPEDLIVSLSMNAAAIVCNTINDYIVGLPAGYRQTQRDTAVSMWMAPYHAETVIWSFLLPKWLGGRTMAFKPTGSLGLAIHERDATRRAPLARRLKHVIWDCKAWVHLCYIGFALAAVAVSIYHSYERRHEGSRGVVLYLITHLLWPPILQLRLLYTNLTPIFYAIFPPTMPTDREEYFTRDPKTGVPTPKPEWKAQRWSWWNKVYEILTLGTASYAFAAVFVVALWLQR